MKWGSIPSPESIEVEATEFSEAELEKGRLDKQDRGDNVLKSVVEHDQKKIDSGKLVSEAINQGFSNFNPDIMMDNLKTEYALAEHIYGSSMFRLLSGYDPSYIKKNINIPEFQRELHKSMQKKLEELKKDGIINKEGDIQDKGLELASLVMYTEELDHLNPKGMYGERFSKNVSHYGEKGESKNFRKGDRYKDIALKKSIKLAIRRNHKKLQTEDLRVFERQQKGRIYVVYAIDASGSMKGKKIEMAKKAGIALAYKAITARDKVGLITFSTDVQDIMHPTLDFQTLIKKIVSIKASRETNLKATLEKSLTLFPQEDATKHLILLTDAVPTIGKDPEKETLELVSKARDNNITISLIGINLDKKAAKFADRIVKTGNGRLYQAKTAEDLDMVILEDYAWVL